MQQKQLAKNLSSSSLSSTNSSSISLHENVKRIPIVQTKGNKFNSAVKNELEESIINNDNEDSFSLSDSNNDYMTKNYRRIKKINNRVKNINIGNDNKIQQLRRLSMTNNANNNKISKKNISSSDNTSEESFSSNEQNNNNYYYEKKNKTNDNFPKRINSVRDMDFSKLLKMTTKEKLAYIEQQREAEQWEEKNAIDLEEKSTKSESEYSEEPNSEDKSFVVSDSEEDKSADDFSDNERHYYE